MSIDPHVYYDRFSSSYNRRRAKGYHALIDELEAEAIPRNGSLRLLEAGCGTGLVMDRLKARGATELFGIDLSAGMLSLAKHGGNHVAQASVTALPFPDQTFDVAYSFKVLAHVPDIRGALAEMSRVIRPGGMLVVEFYNRHSLRALRWLVKHAVGGERTGHQQRETELYTRYDSVREMVDYLPPNTKLEAIRGAVLATPAAAAMQIPGLSTFLPWIERRATASPLARYAGFVILVARRL